MIKLTLAFLLMALLTSCGFKKVAVKNADSIISHQVTKKIPLNSEQKRELDKDIDKLLNDSKPAAEAIIPLIGLLDFSGTEKLESQYKELEAIYISIAAEASVILARHIAKLDSKQQRNFLEKLKKDNDEIKERLKKKSMKKVEFWMKSMLGTINEKQVALMKEYEDYFHERNQLRLERRIRLADKFKEIFAGNPPVQEKEKAIKEAFDKYQADSLEGNKNLEMLKKLVPTISDEQKKHFMKHMENLQELLKYYLTVEY